MRISIARIAIMVVIPFTAAIFAGCSAEKAGPLPTYVYVVDYSNSTSELRRREVGTMLVELETAPENAQVVVYRMGFETQEVYSGPLGDTGIDTLTSTVMRDVGASDGRRGTNFALMAKRVEDFASSFQGKEFQLRILTDGANDFAGDRQNTGQYLAAAKSVATNKKLGSIVFYGVQPGFREELRRAFSKAGTKLQILSQDQMIGE